MGNRRRCTECRRPFTPSPRAVATQRVCRSAACCAARDRKLARARRAEDLDAYREDERLRQREARARRGAAATELIPHGCHAPPSAPKCLDSQEEVCRIVARVLVSGGVLLTIGPEAAALAKESLVALRPVLAALDRTLEPFGAPTPRLPDEDAA